MPVKDRRLADVLADAGRWDEALEILHAEPAGWAGAWLAERFAAAGNVDQLRRLAATGVPEAVANLAAHTLATDDRADAEALVSGWVEAGHPPAERLLAALVDRGEHELAITLTANLPVVDALLRWDDEHTRAIRLLRHGVFTTSDEWDADRGQALLADLFADKGHWSEALELAKGQILGTGVDPEAAGTGGQPRRVAQAGRHRPRPRWPRTGCTARRTRQHDELLDRTRKGDEHCAQRLIALAHDGKVSNCERLLAEGL